MKKDITAMTEQEIKEKEAREFAKKLLKRIDKLICGQQERMRWNNETTEGLLAFLDKYPILFASEYSSLGRDMLKWSLEQNIAYTQSLIDKIQEIEKSHDLPLHGIDEDGYFKPDNKK